MNSLKGVRDWISRASNFLGKFRDDLLYELNTPATQQLPPNERWQVNPDRFPKPVPENRQDRLRQQYVERFNTAGASLAKQLSSGEIDVASWHGKMSIEIQSLHTGLHVIGSGGWGAVTAQSLASIEPIIHSQINFLDNWSMQLSALKPEDMSERAIAYRASLYSGAANTMTFSRAQLSAMGLPELPCYPGERTSCRGNCGCSYLVTKLPGDGNWDVLWIRAKNDSCPECIKREEILNPLRIRQHQIFPFSHMALFTDS